VNNGSGVGDVVEEVGDDNEVPAAGSEDTIIVVMIVTMPLTVSVIVEVAELSDKSVGLDADEAGKVPGTTEVMVSRIVAVELVVEVGLIKLVIPADETVPRTTEVTVRSIVAVELVVEVGLIELAAPADDEGAPAAGDGISESVV
jgi:hypothetical protein